MNTSKIVSLSGALAAGVCALPMQGYAQKAAERPNFVIMIADDCSYYDWGCYGSEDAITPNIDEFASESMKFNRCFQAIGMSSPTRHALYTGIYPVRNGAYPNHTFVYDWVKSFVQYFGDGGYKTALIGKEHVAPKEVFSYEYLGGYNSSPRDYKGMKYNNLEGFLDRTGDDPFFLVVASQEPHSPWNLGDASQWDKDKITVPPLYVDTPETRQDLVNYYAEINVFDSQVGQIRSILEDKEVFDNTVFILLSEQGNSFPFAKWTCYRTGLQSGLLVRWPGNIKAGSENNALVEYIDIVPTCMDIAGLPKSDMVDGKSFKEVLEGKAVEHKEYVFGLQTSRGIIRGPEYYGIRSVKDKQFNYIVNLTPEAAFENTVTAQTDDNGGFWGSWIREADNGDAFAKERVAKYQHRPAEELYDMDNDPWEMNNLANDPRYKKDKERLAKELYKWMEQQGDKGQETEMEALSRLLKNRNKSQE